MDKDLARIKERLDLDEDDEEIDNSSVTIEDHNSNLTSSSKPSIFDSIRASQGRTACCLFIVIICVMVIVILIFAHSEYEAIEANHHHTDNANP